MIHRIKFLACASVLASSAFAGDFECHQILGATSATHGQGNISTYRKVATSPIGSLYVSSAAEAKMKTLDDSIVDLEMASEIGGFGLTRLEGRDVYVEDFVLPERKLFIEGIILPAEVGVFASLLAQSETLTLSARGGRLVVKNPKQDVQIGRGAWLLLQKSFRAMGATFGDYDEALVSLESSGPKILDAAFDLIVTGNGVWFTDHYARRFEAEAARRNLRARFNMHHHPRLGLAVALLRGKVREKSAEYYKQILTPSVADLRAADENLDWLEIRSFGTIEDIGSKTVSAAFYDMRELRAVKPVIQSAIEECLAPTGCCNLDGIKNWLQVRGFEAVEVARYVLGDERHRQIAALLDQNHRNRTGAENKVREFFE